MARLAVCCLLLVISVVSAQDNPIQAVQQEAAAELQTLASTEQQLEQQALDAATQLGGVLSGSAIFNGQQLVDQESQLARLASDEVSALVNGIEAIDNLAVDSLNKAAAA